MNLIDQLQNHACEASCKIAFKAHRELLGVTCKKCQSTDQHWNERKSFWRCGNCDFKTTLKSGTALQHTKMPFKTWFQVVALMSSTTKGFSAKEVQIKMKHKRYEPIWYMMHKIRTQMGKNVMFFDDIEHLFKAEIPGILHENEVSQNQLVSREIQVETVTLKCLSLQKGMTQIKGIRMRHLKAESDLNKEIKVKRKPILQTFGTNPKRKSSKENIQKQSKSTLFAFNCLDNLKRILYEIHHQVKCQYLQNYLDEFCYKFNRKDTLEFGYDEIWQYLIMPKRSLNL